MEKEHPQIDHKANFDKYFSPDEEVRNAAWNKAPLERTGANHYTFGSTPEDPLLAQYPEKTLAEHKSDEELLAYLDEKYSDIVKYNVDYKGDERYSQWKITAEEDFQKDIDYLRKIGRLPSKYENYHLPN